jgi:hypothetical protein
MEVIDQARDATQSLDRVFARSESRLSILAGSSALERDDLDGFGRELRLFSNRLSNIRANLTMPDGAVPLRIGGPKQRGRARCWPPDRAGPPFPTCWHWTIRRVVRSSLLSRSFVRMRGRQPMF